MSPSINSPLLSFSFSSEGSTQKVLFLFSSSCPRLSQYLLNWLSKLSSGLHFPNCLFNNVLVPSSPIAVILHLICLYLYIHYITCTPIGLILFQYKYFYTIVLHANIVKYTMDCKINIHKDWGNQVDLWLLSPKTHPHPTKKNRKPFSYKELPATITKRLC